MLSDWEQFLLRVRFLPPSTLRIIYFSHIDQLYKFWSKSEGVPFQALGDLTWNDPVMKNKIAISDNLILRRIDDQSFSLIGFNQLVINGILSNYSYTCSLQICYTCGRNWYNFYYIIVS